MGIMERIIKWIKDIARAIVIWLILVALGIVVTLLSGSDKAFFILCGVAVAVCPIAIAIYNHKSPVITRKVVVISKRRDGLFGRGLRINLNRRQYITFEFLSDGKTKEFMVSKEEYYEFNEFDFGELTTKGFKYIGFEKRKE